MSKKDYEAIAAILKDCVTVPEVALAIAKYLASENEHFDRHRFLKACDLR